MKLTALPAVVLALCSACASTTEKIAPLAIRRSPDVKLCVEPVVGALKARSSDSMSVPHPLTARQIEVSIYRVDSSVLASVPIRSPSLVSAVTCAGVDVDRWLAALEARGDLAFHPLFDQPSIVLGENPLGFVSVLNQQAFVGGFELQQRGDIGIADPRIDVVTEGLLLEVLMERVDDDSSAKLSIDLTMCELDRPFQERVVHLTSSELPLRVQHPTGVTWTLSVSEQLGDDEVLVLTGRNAPGQDDERALIALVRFAPTIAAAQVEQQAR